MSEPPDAATEVKKLRVTIVVIAVVGTLLIIAGLAFPRYRCDREGCVDRWTQRTCTYQVTDSACFWDDGDGLMMR